MPERASPPEFDSGPRSEPEIEAGLRAGFGRAPAAGSGPGRRPDPSVLERLEAVTGSAPRVHLRDPEDEEAPLVDPRSPEVSPATPGGRYQLVGEVARGGIGTVLKGRDVDLGRDVAIKVLRSEHAADPAMVQRFVEEAQIGGQLQHPGIVPVYEMGLRPDRRPYFTMKMVKGRTLAALLEKRADPEEDQRRFLALFEHVAQTVAYAHARGVIHRDLKPSNIMVGAFGEVQVMDWGLAKVLGRDHPGDAERSEAARTLVETVRTGTPGAESKAGSVLGTPAYVPPEQARGEIDRLDERADVFALGAILCEILTGAPPYRGDTWGDVYLAAAGAELDEAFERLDASPADAELARIARACLAPKPEQRPRNGEVLVQRFSAYLASVEARARAAEVAAAESEAKVKEARRARRLAETLASEERRRRRLVFALAVTLLILLVGGGGGYFWWERAATSRAERAQAAVLEAMDEVTWHREQAKVDAGGGLDHWAKAVSAAARAEELARTDGVVAALRSQVAHRLAAIREEATEAREAVRRGQRAAELRARLEEIRLWTGPAWKRDARAAALEALLPPGSPDRTLPVWLRLATPARTDGSAELHERVREAVVRGDLAALKELGEAADPAKTPAQDLRLLADALGNGGAAEDAVRFLMAARKPRPGEFGINHELARWLTRCDPPRWMEAVRYFTAACALRPTSAAERVNLACALHRTGDLEGAVAHLDQALAVAPELSRELDERFVKALSGTKGN